MPDKQAANPQPTEEIISCAHCGGVGAIVLFTSSRPCIACGGKGKTRRITTTFHDEKRRVRTVVQVYADMPPPAHYDYSSRTGSDGVPSSGAANAAAHVTCALALGRRLSSGSGRS